MRDLRFRLWDKERKCFSYIGLCNKLPINYYDFYDVQQFTGLFDKQGKEIYEGDIVKGKDEVRRIEYKDACFVARKLRDSKNYQYEGINTKYLRFNWKQQFEVIGNIYENKELLE